MDGELTKMIDYKDCFRDEVDRSYSYQSSHIVELEKTCRHLRALTEEIGTVADQMTN